MTDKKIRTVTDHMYSKLQSEKNRDLSPDGPQLYTGHHAGE